MCVPAALTCPYSNSLDFITGRLPEDNPLCWKAVTIQHATDTRIKLNLYLA